MKKNVRVRQEMLHITWRHSGIQMIYKPSNPLDSALGQWCLWWWKEVTANRPLVDLEVYWSPLMRGTFQWEHSLRLYFFSWEKSHRSVTSKPISQVSRKAFMECHLTPTEGGMRGKIFILKTETHWRAHSPPQWTYLTQLGGSQLLMGKNNHVGQGVSEDHDINE